MKFIYLIFALILVAVHMTAAAQSKPKKPPRLCQIYCPDVEDPVCGKRGSVRKIFPNPCRLNAANMCADDGEKWTKC